MFLAKNKITLYLTFLLIIFSNLCQSQNTKEDGYFNPLTDDITNKIPPLEILIDSAVANDPNVKTELLQLSIDRYQISSSKRDWTKSLGVQGMVDYGNWNYNDKDELSNLDRFYRTTSMRSTYEIGVYIKMPFNDFYDRKNQINISKKRLEQTMIQKEKRIREIRQIIITEYNFLIKNQNLIKVASSFQQYTLVQMRMAENQFLNHEITTAELTRLKEIQKTGQIELEKYRGDFINAYMILEEMTGIKFNLINELK